MSQPKVFRVFITSLSAPTSQEEGAETKYAYGIYFEVDPSLDVCKLPVPHNPLLPPCTKDGCYDQTTEKYVWRYAHVSETATSNAQAQLEAMLFVVREHNNDRTPASPHNKIVFVVSSKEVSDHFGLFIPNRFDLHKEISRTQQTANYSFWSALRSEIDLDHWDYDARDGSQDSYNCEYEASTIRGRWAAESLAAQALGVEPPHKVAHKKRKREAAIYVAESRVWRAKETLRCAEATLADLQSAAEVDA